MNQDKCDGAGSCTDNGFKASTTACGSPSDTECDNPDHCSGTSAACLPNYEPVGTACGNPTNTTCNGADTCNGVGACQANLAGNGTTCNDGNACTQTDTCQAGLCTGAEYSWSGVLQPINADNSSVFKLGSTIPVKFKLTGACAGNSNFIAKIYLAKVDNNVEGTETEAISTSAADSGNTFRYDPTSDQYIFNLATKSLSQGTWQIRIDGNLHNPPSKTVLISSRK